MRRRIIREKDIYHKARKITYQDKTKKGKIRFISLLTNDFQMSAEDIIAIYKRRWQIETLFKQIKQNFPLRYFYGESANAIKIQIWITLIANLLITLVKDKIKRPWSFSGLATMIRILLMSYVSIQGFFEQPHRDWEMRTVIIRFLILYFLANFLFVSYILTTFATS